MLLLGLALVSVKADSIRIENKIPKNSMIGMLLLSSEPRTLAETSSSNEIKEPDWCSDIDFQGNGRIVQFLALSGRSPNDLGNYDACRDLSND